jgi:hypothetical protein
MENCMRKPILLFLLLVAIFLAGCLPQTQAVVPTATAIQPPQPVATNASVIPSQAALLPDSGCTVVARQPAAGPTPQTVYPPITEQDWTKGPADARVTLIEYSDFQ